MKTSAFSTILVFFVLTVAGLAFIPLLSVKLVPSMDLPSITVGFNMSGSSSRVVEIEATSKLEAMLSRVSGVEEINSTSGNGWGRVSVRFNKHTDLDAARFEVSTVVRQTWSYLPDNVSYPYVSMSRSDERANTPFLSFTVNAPAAPIVIQQYVENNIKPKLAQIGGINSVEVRGATPMEWRLEYDNGQLETLGITVTDIQSAINSFLKHEFLGTASMETPDGERQWIRLAIAPQTASRGGARPVSTTDFDVSKIGIRNIDGKIITLDQLVSVAHVEQKASSYYRINGLNSIYLSIKAEDNANQLELSRKIKNKISELEVFFPSGYAIHVGYDATEYIQEELDKMYFRSGLTFAILLLFVLFIYHSWKYLLLITTSLLMNICIAFIFYYFCGMEMQLYSLAGITISLTLLIDNTIVMSDQIIKRRNMHAFPAILAATLTTIASLVIIFFMDKKVRLNLQDFAGVLIVNLAVSLFTALFLVPAMIEKLNLTSRPSLQRRGGAGQLRFLPSLFKRSWWVRYFNLFYSAFCRFEWRWRVIACILIVLAFGLPVYMLPEKVEGDGFWAETYNKTLGSTVYIESVKPVTDVCLGGTLRLFAQKVSTGGIFNNSREETSIFVTATLPNGSTVEQMNSLIRKMESYISQFSEIKQFQTSIENARHANISIQFTKESTRTGFPYMLKSKLIKRATELGGGSWGVFGLGDGFSNDVRERAGNYRVVLYGFNYDELSEWAKQFKDTLLEHRRIKDVVINSEFSWYKDDYREFTLSLDMEKLAQANIQPEALFTSLKSVFGNNIQADNLAGADGYEQILLQSRQSKEYDVWSLENVPMKLEKDGREYKISELATIEKSQTPKNIVKENQQYRLCLQYEYIGSSEQGWKVLEKHVEDFQKLLPMGYTIKNQDNYWSWGRDAGGQYRLLFLIFVIIYFMCSILFNSLKLPFAVLFVIPISFIGIFLTFYLFDINFDQGGFASFVLLCGLSVNSNVYVLNEYSNIRKKRPLTEPLQAYIKAWNAKIVPIFLTVISTVLGFVPFMIGYRESFWFPLAAGTVGGLVTSLVGLFCFLPLFMGVGKNKKITDL